MGQGSTDVVIMSYMSGTVSVLGGLLGCLAMWGAIKVYRVDGKRERERGSEMSTLK